MDWKKLLIPEDKNDYPCFVIEKRDGQSFKVKSSKDVEPVLNGLSRETRKIKHVEVYYYDGNNKRYLLSVDWH